jgi:hypothetical protein
VPSLFLDRATIWSLKPLLAKFWSDSFMAGKNCLNSRHFIHETKILQVNYPTNKFSPHLKKPWQAKKCLRALGWAVLIKSMLP